MTVFSQAGFRAALVGAASAATMMFGATGAMAAVLPAEAVGICPAIGADTDCGTVIVITDGGALTFTGLQGPYDGIEDTLVGILNQSSTALTSIGLSGGNIFGFDGDGLVVYGGTGNASDPTGYGGPNTTFTVTDNNNGFVNFLAALQTGESAYFSLEEDITSVIVTTVNGDPVSDVPLPASALVLLTALSGFGALRLRRRRG